VVSLRAGEYSCRGTHASGTIKLYKLTYEVAALLLSKGLPHKLVLVDRVLLSLIESKTRCRRQVPPLRVANDAACGVLLVEQRAEQSAIGVGGVRQADGRRGGGG